MCDHPITGSCLHLTCLLNLFRQGTVLLLTKTSSRILPGIQRTDAGSFFVNIHDPMHLSGKSDLFHFRISVQKIVQHLSALLYDIFCILDSFPVTVRCEKASVFYCFCLKNPSFLCFVFFQNHTTDGCCSDINSYCFHNYYAPLIFCELNTILALV